MLFSIVALAFVVPHSGATTITDHSCTRQSLNTMRYDCHVELSSSAIVKIGHRPSGTSTWSWSIPQSGDDLDFTVYNFEPDVPYDYRIQVVGEATWEQDVLYPDPELPEDLGDLALTVTRKPASAVDYVLFDTMDCTLTKQYLVAVNTAGGYIAWYLDFDLEVGATSTLQEWSYTSDHTILGTVDKRNVYEWNWKGEVVNMDSYAHCNGADSSDVGPCPHHDAFKNPDNGLVYTITAVEDTTIAPSTTADFGTCTASDGFIDDGFDIRDGTFSVTDDYRLMSDFGYDPSVDGGPTPTACGDVLYWTDGDAWFDPAAPEIDYTHVNSIYARSIGGPEIVTLSLRNFSEVVQINASTGNVLWTLNGEDSSGRGDYNIVLDTAVTGGDARFSGQHHVTEANGLLQMFDNRLNIGGAARVIRLDLVPGSPGTATIIKSWEMREPGTPWSALDCHRGLGSAVTIPGFMGNRVLANCGPQTVIEELSEYDGERTTDPLLYISLDHVSPTYDYCSGSSGTGDTMHWYRAWPLAQIGEY